MVGGKLAFGGLLAKIGGSSGSVQIGANAGMFSLLQDFTPSEHERLNAVLDDIYATFKKRVADGRKLSASQVEAVAKGRVWSGADAKARGLVDVLGGFDTALALAKQAAGIPAKQSINLKLFPPPKSEFDRLLSRLDDDTLGAFAAILPPRFSAFLRASFNEAALSLAPEGALTMPPIVIR